VAAFYSAFSFSVFLASVLFEEVFFNFLRVCAVHVALYFVARFFGDALKMLVVGPAGIGGERASGTPAWAPRAAGATASVERLQVGLCMQAGRVAAARPAAALTA